VEVFAFSSGGLLGIPNRIIKSAGGARFVPLGNLLRSGF